MRQPPVGKIGIVVHYAVAGALSCVMGVALTTFLKKGSTPLNLLAVGALAAVFLTLFALVSSAAFRFRAKTGRLPRTLDELGPKFVPPDILRDPFSG